MPARDPRIRARVVAFACLAFFVTGGLGRQALGGALTSWDQRFMLATAAQRSAVVAGWMGVLSAIGQGAFAIPAGIAVFLVLLIRRWRRAAFPIFGGAAMDAIGVGAPFDPGCGSASAGAATYKEVRTATDQRVSGSTGQPESSPAVAACRSTLSCEAVIRRLGSG